MDLSNLLPKNVLGNDIQIQILNNTTSSCGFIHTSKYHCSALAEFIIADIFSGASVCLVHINAAIMEKLKIPFKENKSQYGTHSSIASKNLCLEKTGYICGNIYIPNYGNNCLECKKEENKVLLNKTTSPFDILDLMETLQCREIILASNDHLYAVFSDKDTQYIGTLSYKNILDTISSYLYKSNSRTSILYVAGSYQNKIRVQKSWNGILFEQIGNYRKEVLETNHPDGNVLWNDNLSVQMVGKKKIIGGFYSLLYPVDYRCEFLLRRTPDFGKCDLGSPNSPCIKPVVMEVFIGDGRYLSCPQHVLNWHDEQDYKDHLKELESLEFGRHSNLVNKKECIYNHFKYSLPLDSCFMCEKVSETALVHNGLIAHEDISFFLENDVEKVIIYRGGLSISLLKTQAHRISKRSDILPKIWENAKIRVPKGLFFNWEIFYKEKIISFDLYSTHLLISRKE